MPAGKSTGLDPIEPGTEVAIFRFADGILLVEGRASVVCACASYPDWYQVQFKGERVSRVRLVIPEFQVEPERLVDRLRELLRTGGDSPFDDFWQSEK